MELLPTILLLAIFIYGVQLTAMGAVGDGIAGLFSDRFRPAEPVVWPIVRQADLARGPLRTPMSRASLPAETEDGWLRAEIIEEGVRPVAVSPVCRVR